MPIDAANLSWKGPPLARHEWLARLPAELAELLREMNGCGLFAGGLHIRGLCKEPAWHALQRVWEGEHALHRTYPALRTDDIPFAQDCVGDQFLLREGKVIRLQAEAGTLEETGQDLRQFLDAAQADPVNVLRLQPLVSLFKAGGELKPGELISVYPPYVVQHEGEYDFRAVPALERLAFLADMAAKLRDLPDGESFQVIAMP